MHKILYRIYVEFSMCNKVHEGIIQFSSLYSHTGLNYINAQVLRPLHTRSNAN